MLNPPADPSLLNEYDPTVPETFDSAHEVFADLRARCPVAHSTAFDGFWAVTRYQDVYDMLMQPDLYITSVRNVVPDLRRPAAARRCTWTRRITRRTGARSIAHSAPPASPASRTSRAASPAS